jgi:hypothetical protein
MLHAETMTGYPVKSIPDAINQIYPAGAYEPIPYGNMAGKTDLGQEWVRDRLDMVFGPHGYGWRLTPHGNTGTTLTTEEMRPAKVKQGEPPRDTRWYVVQLESWVFEYCLEINDRREWMTASGISGSDDNTELPYAYKGAFTNLMKHALRTMGGIAHIYAGYGHEQAKKGNHADAWYKGTLGVVGKHLVSDYARSKDIALENLGAILGLAKKVKGEYFPGDVNDAKVLIDDYIAKGKPELVQPDPVEPAYVPDAAAIASLFVEKVKEVYPGITKEQIIGALKVKRIVDFDWLNHESDAYALVETAMANTQSDPVEPPAEPVSEFTGDEVLAENEKARTWLFNTMKARDSDSTPKKIIQLLGGEKSFREPALKSITLKQAMEKLDGTNARTE